MNQSQRTDIAKDIDLANRVKYATAKGTKSDRERTARLLYSLKPQPSKDTK